MVGAVGRVREEVLPFSSGAELSLPAVGRTSPRKRPATE